MNRKHNPMLSLAALVLLAVILALACTGCYEPSETQTQAPVEATAPMEPQETTESTAAPLDRFDTQWRPQWHGDLYIITDKETGIQYLAFETSTGVGMTQLLPGEG